MPDEKRVVVLGQMARDLVLRVGEVPPRGGTTPVTERLEMLGGKGANQAVALAQLGMRPALVAAAGDDEVAGRLLRRAAADGIDVSCVVRRAGARTALIVSVVDPGGWRYLEDIPDATLATEEDVAAATGLAEGAGTMLIQLQQPPAVTLAAAALGRQAGCRVVIDGAPAAGYRDRLLASADVVRADNHEAELLTGHPVRSGAEAITAGQEILQSGPSLAALAAGRDGNAVVWPGGSVLVPLTGGPVADTTGAGDAFTATLVAGLARGLDPAECARRATASAGRTVRHLGGRPHLESWPDGMEESGS